MKFTQTILLSTSILLLSSCGDDEDEVANDESAVVEEVPIVQDTVTLQHVRGVVHNNNDIEITTGPGRKKFITISIDKTNVNEDYATAAVSNSDPNISVTASWDGLPFIQSEQHSTNVSFEFISIDSENLLAAAKFSAFLVNPETNEMLMVNESVLEIGGLNFNTLIQGQ